MTQEDAPTPVTELSFEAALAELEALVDRLDRGDVELAQSIAAYERGTALRRHCERLLDDARLRVEQITGDGTTTVPFGEPGTAVDGADDGGGA